MRGMFAFAALIGLISLGGCISSSGEVPEWFEQRSAANDSSYPSLRDVPRSTTANTDADHWEAVEQDLIAAGEAVKANPRAQPAAQAQDPAVFVEQARQELEETRQSHEP